LLKRIEGFGKYIAITGFRNVKLANVEELFSIVRKEINTTVEIQFFDAKFVATWQHFYFAVLNASTAFKNKENISKSLAMETMLYASAQRQIRKAMKLLGIKSDTSEIAALIIGEKLETVKSALSVISAHINAHPDDTILELSEEKMKAIQKAFGISDVELETVTKRGEDLDEALKSLIIERMALLSTQR